MTDSPSMTLVGVVAEHYKKTEAAPLLLANLGLELRKLGLWPNPEHPEKNLREYIETFSPELIIVRHPSSPARIAVSDKEHLASVQDALASKAETKLDIDITKIPRTVLLAFCVGQQPDHSVWLKKSPPHFYRLQEPKGEELADFWEIKPKYRLPKLHLADPKKLHDSDRIRLGTNIQTWCSELGIPSAHLQKQLDILRKNALQRLIEAQPAEVRRLLLIPADIALLLSERE